MAVEPIPDLPTKLSYEIARRAIESEKGDRMWVMMTRLLRNGEGMLPWQRQVRHMDRPLRWTIFVHPDRTYGKFDQSCVAYCEVGAQNLALDDIRAICRLTDYFGKVTEHTMKKEKEGCFSFWMGTEISIGLYTVELAWNNAIPLRVYIGPFRYKDSVRGIDSFGSQNLLAFYDLAGFAAPHFYVPYLLSHHMNDLDGLFKDSDIVSCRGLEYWDLKNVRTMRDCLRSAVKFRADLSRWVLPTGCDVTGAFLDCDLSAFPPTYDKFRRQQIRWVDLRFMSTREKATIAFVVACIMAALVFIVLPLVAVYARPIAGGIRSIMNVFM